MPASIQQRFTLPDRVALVTGASKGIGESIARALAEAGARVVVSSRRQEAVDEVAHAIVQGGGDAIAVAAHVGRLDDARALVERTVAHYGGVDIVVNNAATNPVFGPILQADDAAFDKIMAVNVKGPARDRPRRLREHERARARQRRQPVEHRRRVARSRGSGSTR
jgi:NAD(P)-dependent dehydrogenase (short-subunit alcohol dehydrogenase family)